MTQSERSDTGVTAGGATKGDKMYLATTPEAKQSGTLVLETFEIAYRTDIGLIRQGNEDNYFVVGQGADLKTQGVLVGVADGMGGHNAGEVASLVAVETLASYYDPAFLALEPEERLADAVKRANIRILDLSNQNLDMQGLGTTLTALCLKESKAIVAHVGDCRIYLYRRGQLSQMTMDHSLVQEAVREGILTPEQARVHPQRNIITRALGTQDDLEVDTLTLPIQAGDVYLLASDGLHGLIEDFEIEDIIHQEYNNVDRITEALVQSALAEGGNDNVTVVVVKVPQAEGALDGEPGSPGGPGDDGDVTLP
ncbi:MAG: Stp1/IreP family PP2C-type Ser/Thr phosphatase [Candidatus Riflebacteria bacterium]|nr:Stp1/IreP family PP2C-type Ser/Thr phosphatase [Candidatus Riflebacteria bacterium]